MTGELETTRIDCGWSGGRAWRGGAARGAGVCASEGQAQAGLAIAGSAVSKGRFLLGLNTSTIRGQKLSIVEEIELARKAGYQAMEPWIDELERYAESGGSLEDLGKRFRDAGISVESAIGFFDWVVDDQEGGARGSSRPAARWSWSAGSAASDWLRRRSARPIGGWRTCFRSPSAIAACSSSATRSAWFPRWKSGVGRRPLSRLGEAAQVAIESQHPKACILPDVYHLYRGGSGFDGIKLLGRESIHVFHFNDYPADPRARRRPMRTGFIPATALRRSRV